MLCCLLGVLAPEMAAHSIYISQARHLLAHLWGGSVYGRSIDLYGKRAVGLKRCALRCSARMCNTHTRIKSRLYDLPSGFVCMSSFSTVHPPIDETHNNQYMINGVLHWATDEYANSATNQRKNVTIYMFIGVCTTRPSATTLYGTHRALTIIYMMCDLVLLYVMYMQYTWKEGVWIGCVKFKRKICV